ncbi:MAG: alcohol dehydrogenase catalytic domain-containing protein [Chloroflexi bacterium]|nr:alcohol dehydrogenase catalytic domain-containing protein [Chloroflexota bacterium]MBV9897124.1 alcohol dehydrogenase catalytic domain-containing protein [Chloroflexota bacterium]
MRAAVLFGPNDLRVVDKPVPEPGPGEVLVKVAMCGTCGTDLKLQTHPFPNQPPFGQFTPGHEWSGTVAKLGDTVDELAIGDRVAIEAHHGCGRCENCVLGMYTACLNYGNLAKGHRASGMTADGGFAEYAVHHVSSLYRLPNSLTWEDAVLVTTAGTSLYGLDAIGGYVAGQSVVVIGPGPVGLMTVQACKALGASPVVLVGTRRGRLALGARLGADCVIDATTSDAVSSVRGVTGGFGADLVIEASGAMPAPQQAVEMVKRGGKILFLGFYPGPVTLDLSSAIRDDVTLYTTRGEGANAVKRALSLAAQGKIRGRELVTHHFPLEAIQEGFRVVRERDGDPIKVVFVP